MVDYKIKIKKRKPAGGYILDINGREYTTVSKKSYDTIIRTSSAMKIVKHLLTEAIDICDKE